MLKIFIPHRLKYKDEMYEEVCELLYEAEETGDLPPWDDLSLKEERGPPWVSRAPPFFEEHEEAQKTA